MGLTEEKKMISRPQEELLKLVNNLKYEYNEIDEKIKDYTRRQDEIKELMNEYNKIISFLSKNSGKIIQFDDRDIQNSTSCPTLKTIYTSDSTSTSHPIKLEYTKNNNNKRNKKYKNQDECVLDLLNKREITSKNQIVKFLFKEGLSKTNKTAAGSAGFVLNKLFKEGLIKRVRQGFYSIKHN